jgi:hypothetical protein
MGGTARPSEKHRSNGTEGVKDGVEVPVEAPASASSRIKLTAPLRSQNHGGRRQRMEVPVGQEFKDGSGQILVYAVGLHHEKSEIVQGTT